MIDKSILAICTIVLATTSLAAHAESGNVEITPYGGFSFGGTFSDLDEDISANIEDTENFGLILDFRADAQTQWEILYSRQATSADIRGGTGGDVDVDLDVHYLQGDGTYQGDTGTVRPYLAATIGATHFDVKSSNFDSDTFFSFSIGTGLQIRPNERLGLRLEARIFGTLVSSGSSIFCLSDPANGTAGCAITVAGEVFWQTQAMAGIVFRF